jgi:hypothetical protein
VYVSVAVETEIETEVAVETDVYTEVYTEVKASVSVKVTVVSVQPAAELGIVVGRQAQPLRIRDSTSAALQAVAQAGSSDEVGVAVYVVQKSPAE